MIRITETKDGVCITERIGGNDAFGIPAVSVSTFARGASFEVACMTRFLLLACDYRTAYGDALLASAEQAVQDRLAGIEPPAQCEPDPVSTDTPVTLVVPEEEEVDTYTLYKIACAEIRAEEGSIVDLS